MLIPPDSNSELAVPNQHIYLGATTFMRVLQVLLTEYLTKIMQTLNQGDAREESYYSALQKLLEKIGTTLGVNTITVTVLPKKTEAGNPDFRVWKGQRKIVGYVEAKPPDKDLNEVEKTEQLRRYRSTFQNLILTDFFEFRLFRNDVCVDTVRVFDSTNKFSPKTAISSQNEARLTNLLEKFFSFSLPSITSAHKLSIELAKRTRFLRDEVMIKQLDEKEGDSQILGFYEAFRRYLIAGLTKQDFADIYSQTITYGLFAARMLSNEKFDRRLAVHNIPHTIGILRDIFQYISLGQLPSQLEWIVDEISNVLDDADTEKITSQFDKTKTTNDPIFQFYETFLAEYDPNEKEKRGVYYTPESVVSYIVRSINGILKTKFDLTDGLGSNAVTVLDPAGGTLTFLATAVRQSVIEFVQKYGAGGKHAFITEHILKNFYGFELMVAPYAMGHLKMSLLFQELGHKLANDERVKFYLTNTLEFDEIEQTALPGMASLSEESHLAGIVKKKTPILIIIGNPPYSGHSSNKGEWISNTIKEYYSVDGEPLHEKNSKWLQDDYVKFIRFAQWKIDQAGEGILGFITNHAYLDNPTFRGMRQSLMKSFDELYVLDLHGNSSKGETAPDGSKDENVFDIRQGVAIALFIKKKTSQPGIYHSDLWGLRERKYQWLTDNSFKTTPWEKLTPKTPFYLFIPRNTKSEKVYNKFTALPTIFPIHSIGIQTHRDDLVIDTDKEALKDRIRTLRNSSISDSIIRKNMKIEDTGSWNLEQARKKLQADDEWEARILPVAFRPFDNRWLFYQKDLVDRPRTEVMQHMARQNLGLNAMRQFAYNVETYNYALITDSITDSRIFISNKGAAYFFPLYLYHIAAKTVSKIPNLNSQLMETLETMYRFEVTPEQLLYYVYAVLYSDTYRKKYYDFLEIDFPRIPFTNDVVLFKKLAQKGETLVDLHLFRSAEPLISSVKFHGEGERVVQSPIYDEEQQRLYVNKLQYFSGMKKAVWEYQIGGYQVLYKWVKDRKGATLSLDEIKHYCTICRVLEKTRNVQNEIDELYPHVQDTLFEFTGNENATLKEYLSS